MVNNTKYLISWTNLEEVNTFYSSSPHQVEIVDGKQEVLDYLKWCQLTERMSLSEFLKKTGVFIYEIKDGLHVVCPEDLEALK